MFIAALLSVEFLDEIVDGAYRAAWPLIRTDLHLSYAEIGLLLSVPALLGASLEMTFGILGDVWNRRALVLGGGAFFALALVLTGLSQNFPTLFAAWVVFFPAGGAFVNLSQAALMDADPSERERNMARWVLAGSSANVAGPLALAAAVALGAGWRALFFAIAALALVALLFLRRFPFPLPACDAETEEGEASSARERIREGVRAAFHALRRREVLRWLALVEICDLMLDKLSGFVALYFVDVAGASEESAALAVLVWTCAGLAGSFLLISALRRVNGLRYLRASAWAALIVFPLFLLFEDSTLKIALLGTLGLANAGWYPVLAARLYAEVPNRSGTVMTLANIAGLFNNLAPLALGLFAQKFGLAPMMWLLLVAPFALLFGLYGASGKAAGGIDRD